MKILKLCVAVVSIIIALFFCIHLNMIGDDSGEMYSVPTNEALGVEYPTQLPVHSKGKVIANKVLTTEKPVQEIDPPHTETPASTPVDIPKTTASQPNGAFAAITIKTDMKNGSYTVMPDVYKNTLRHNIGWLPSSSLPGQDGTCVLMGHRDTDLKILQYLKTGDEIVVERNEIKFTYTVYKIEIVNSDSDLRFTAQSDTGLILVTCYPFRYSGHAPQKYVIHSSLKSDK